MCGIYGLICPYKYQKTICKKFDLAKVKSAHKLLRHRGPDWEGELIGLNYYLAHHRLSIVDPTGGSQPITCNLIIPNITSISTSTNIDNDNMIHNTIYCDKDINQVDTHHGIVSNTKIYQQIYPIGENPPDFKYSLCVNGEIYNHVELKDNLKYKLVATGDGQAGHIMNYVYLTQPSKYYPYDKYTYKTASDCEVLIALYDRAMNYEVLKYDENCHILHDHDQQQGCILDNQQKTNIINSRLTSSLNEINGIYAFILADEVRGQYLIARDPIGIIPLYYGYDSDGFIHVASEMKAFPADVIPQHFPPGHFMLVHNEDIGKTKPIPIKYYSKLDELTELTELNLAQCAKQETEPNTELATHYDINSDVVQKYALEVRQTLIRAVEQQLMADVPFGALLSGGLDSSLVCAIACKALEESNKSDGHVTGVSHNKLQTFSIGLEGGNATDLEAATRAAKWLGTTHHNFTFTIDEGLAAIRDVIWHLETYDVTTIRASTPMYLLARKIKAMGIKMVLSGEGSDEIFGGYLYFLKAPSDSEHTKECIRRVSQLSLFDCLRANKSTMAWGLEARPPFLDVNLIDIGLQIPAALKKMHRDGHPVEKWILRAAFDVRDDKTNEPMYLPDDLLWRQKEQFSDGVGYGWIDRLKAEAEKQVSDYILSLALDRFPINTPTTKEEYRYRVIFSELFPNRGAEYTVEKWVPKTNWQGVSYDPSGRAQSSHNSTYRPD